ncbi:2-oxoadipate dioxygenase/decarboxylase HglS [Roseateles sp. P5_D6]
MPMSFTPDQTRARFAEAMSQTYRQEVPLYGHLVDLVNGINAEQGTEGSRLAVERHGAIRVGTAAELSMMRRLLAVLGMQPVGYYDLSVAGIPVHSTAFRPVGEASLARNPFRLFCSLLRTELIACPQVRQLAENALTGRQIFTPGCVRLIERFEARGALSADEAEEFVQETLHTFRWRGHATVSQAVYSAIKAQHPLAADVACFPNPHINHLTPRVLDIDAAQAAMRERGLPAKAVIEGPPRRAVPILLRQTAFSALCEDVTFADGTRGDHTARFGEIEQRGCALTPKGRQLYDKLLERARRSAQQHGAVEPKALAENLHREFEAFPDDLEALRREGLAYFRYSLSPEAGKVRLPASLVDINALVREGLLHVEPLTYEDFLPVSAAGIFRSNLGEQDGGVFASHSNRAAFEAALGANVLNEFELYREAEGASLANCLRQLARAA